MTRLIRIAAIFISISIIVQPTLAQEVHWPGWLGPMRNGWVEHFQVPSEWPKELKKVWQVDVGIGYATPIVAEGLVYQYARQGKEEVLWCFDLKSGEQKWRTSYAVPFTMGQGGAWHGKGPKSNPILADGRLFTMSISGILTAWDAETGNKIWQRDYNKRFAKPKPTPYWGATTSPIVEGDRVFVHFGNDDKGLLAALDVATGEDVWTNDQDATSYSSPLLAMIHGVRQLVEWNHRAVVGVEIETGKVLWEYPFEHEGSNQNMPTPSIHHGRILVGGENRGLRSVEPTLTGSNWSVNENWHQKGVALDMSSAVVNGGSLYGFSHYEKGRLFCVDTKSGEILWQGPRRTGDNVAFLSIPKFVLALTDKGELQVIQASGAESQQVASYKVSDSPTWAAPILLKDGVLVKDNDKLTLWSMR